jgi:hypothetical protein
VHIHLTFGPPKSLFLARHFLLADTMASAKKSGGVLKLLRLDDLYVIGEEGREEYTNWAKAKGIQPNPREYLGGYAEGTRVIIEGNGWLVSYIHVSFSLSVAHIVR